MRDTNEKFEKFMIKEYQKLSDTEKFNKMLSLNQTVRQIIISQLPKGLSPLEQKIKLFEIYYKDDFSKEDYNKWFKLISGNKS